MQSDPCNRPYIVESGKVSLYVGRNYVSVLDFYVWWADVFIDSYVFANATNGCNLIFHNDWIFLITKTRIQLDGGRVAAIKMPTADLYSYDNMVTSMAGWGITQPGGGRSEYLRWSDVIIQPDEYCHFRMTPGSYGQRGSMLCGYSLHGGCPGDSGGPVMTYENNTWVLIGIYLGDQANRNTTAGNCGPNRLQLIRRFPAHWGDYVRRLAARVAFGRQPARDELLRLGPSENDVFAPFVSNNRSR